MKAVVTGSRGFVGLYLTDYLVGEGWQVGGLNLRDGYDIREYEAVRDFLDIHRPDVIFHLAAQAFVPESFANPQRTIEVNTLGSLNLLEAVRQLGLKTTVHLAGTSEEYGDAEPNPSGALNPSSPYAVSKIAMDYLGQLYARAYGLHVVVTRAFNHTGPGRGEMYAESAFAKQIAEIEVGKRQVLEHGNLGATRNYTDVRDVVRAYALAPQLDTGVYNICSTQSVTMRTILDTLIGLARVKIPTREQESLKRPNDFSFKEPSCSIPGWKPTYALEQTLGDILNYWRERV